jgi:hypothetical protein
VARSTFGPVVLLGLASSGLTAAASNQRWSTSDDPSAAFQPIATGAESPLALSLGLAVLAGWGVLLILRGRVRRALAWLLALGSIGVTATVVTAHAQLAEQVHGWYWTALIASLISVAAAALAVRHVRSWPEMGSKYDAPGAAHAPPEPETPLEIWKAIDEGRDPTL